MSGSPYGPSQGVGGPPLPSMPSSPPPAPPDAWRAAAVALLNLSGLGLGYALLRRWVLMALCWTATAVPLLVAVPADADGIPGAALVGFAVLLLLAALHGARAGLRTRLAWPARAPLALLLGVLLLAVPAGGALWYRDAHDEAVEQALLDRLDKADHLVATSGRRSFTSAESGYRSALEVYRDLAEHHSGSRVARRLPGSLRTYCTTVGAAYGHQEYCDAIEPLKYPRTVPGTMPEGRLGSPARRPDDRLATSLYECGAQGLTTGGTDWGARFGDLLNTFPPVRGGDQGPARRGGGRAPGGEGRRRKPTLHRRGAVARPGHPDRRTVQVLGRRGRHARQGRRARRAQRRRGGVRLRSRPVHGRRLRGRPDAPEGRREAAHHRLRRQYLRHGEERQPVRHHGALHRPGHRQLHPQELRRLQGVHPRRHRDDRVQAVQRQRQALPAAHHQPPGGHHLLRARAERQQHRDPGLRHGRAAAGYIYTECAYTTQTFGSGI